MESPKTSGKVCLLMLEGIGVSEDETRNAVRMGKMEFLESLKTEEKTLYYELEANGEKVGVPDGVPGNNGIGVLVIGTGKRQYRNILRISQMIADGSLQKNEVLCKVLQDTKEGNGRLHLIGCLTNSQEEAEMGHLYALMDYAKEAGVEHCFVHGILDGEDAPTGVGLEMAKELEDRIDEKEYGRIGSIAGRSGILDIKDSLATLEKYFKTLAFGENLVTLAASEYIQIRYDQLEEDSMVQPATLDEDAVLRDGDHVLFFNVRTGDTAVLMHTLLFCDTSIAPTEESKKMMESLPFMATIAKPSISVACLVQYDDSSDCPIMVPPLPIQKTFVRVLGEAGKKQLRMSEESRFTHIRFLLNGAGDVSVPGDDAVMVHDKSGEHTRETIVGSMDAIANMISNALQTGYYDVITTMLSAAGIASSSKSVELTADMCGQVDRVVKRIAEEAEKDGYSVVIVGTHSEATHVPEKDDERGPCNNVPCFIRPCEGVSFEKQELPFYSLENVAATCLKIVGVEPCEQMEPALV